MRLLGRFLWLTITVMLILLAVTFAASNQRLVDLHLWPFERAITAPLWLSLMISFIAGGIIGALLLWGQALAIRTKNWRLQRQIDKLQRDAAQAAPARPAIGKPEQTAQPDSSLD
ncbi:MAG: LapA family protein [Candidatus Puniceispirillum sp.]